MWPYSASGAPERRAGLEAVHVGQAPLDDDRGRAPIQRRPSPRSTRRRRSRTRERVRHVDAADGRDTRRGSAGARRRLAHAARRYASTISPTTSSPSPTTTKSMNGAMRLRVGERAHAAHQHERDPRRPARDARAGNARHVEQPQHVDVVALVGDREADEVEVRRAGRSDSRLNGGVPVRAELLDVLGIGQEHPLAHHVGQQVEVRVDRLEAEVRHAHRVGVRVDQGDRDAAPPVLADRSLLARHPLLNFLLQRPRHTAPSLPRPLRSLGAGRSPHAIRARNWDRARELTGPEAPPGDSPVQAGGEE